MKLAAVLFVFCILTGCSTPSNDFDRITEFRKQLIDASQCTFDATINAYHSDNIYQFQMTCHVNDTGTLSFTVIEPETICGITGKISNDGAVLTFDDQVLAFPALADERFSPVCAPWIFYQTLRGGNFTGCLQTSDGMLLSIDDSYNEDPLHLQIQTDSGIVPIHAEIYHKQHMVLSLEISNFVTM